jgi:hypothetical protein
VPVLKRKPSVALEVRHARCAQTIWPNSILGNESAALEHFPLRETVRGRRDLPARVPDPTICEFCISESPNPPAEARHTLRAPAR